jgi:hypothetical protein
MITRGFTSRQHAIAAGDASGMIRTEPMAAEAPAQSKGAAPKSGPSRRLAFAPHYSWELSPPRVGFGLEVSEAEEPGGAELCSLAPLD